MQPQEFHVKFGEVLKVASGVNSVNGMTGDVILGAGDVGADTKEEVNGKITIAVQQLEGEIEQVRVAIPTKTSELENDSDYVSDAEYVHTDNNFTTEEKTKLSGLENYDDTEIRGEIEDIQDVIPAQATESNQLADKNFVNSSLNSITAFYITKDAAGTQFATKADLDATTTFYSGGEVRVPTRNDYCIVLADETKTDPVTGENPTTRYIYQTNGWEFQYVVNKTTLTAAQLATLNSGFVAADRTKLNGIEAGAQVNKLEGVQIAGTDLTITDKKVNIPYADTLAGGVVKVLANTAIGTDGNGYLYALTKNYTEYNSGSNNAFIGKGTLENVIAGKELENKVTDVQVNGTTILNNNKVANIPTATDSTFGVVKSSTNTFKVLTSAEYDALTTHDSNTLYLVRGE